MQVSAEVAAVSLDQPFELKKVHKSTDAEEGIRTAMQYCFLFAGTWHLLFLAIWTCRQHVNTSSSGAERQTGHSLCSKVLAGLQTWKKNRRMMLCTPCSKELWYLMRHSSGKLSSSLLSRFDLLLEMPTHFSANKCILQYISGCMGTEDFCKSVLCTSCTAYLTVQQTRAPLLHYNHSVVF